MEKPSCRICLEESGILVSPCACKGSSGFVHGECLERWMKERQGDDTCEICQEKYKTIETVACNMSNYCDGFFSFRHKSEMEGVLIKMTSLHTILAILFYSWTSVDDWVIQTSAQTLSIFVVLICIQLLYTNVEYFVLNVGIWWSTAYMLSVIMIGTIRSIDNDETCDHNCLKLVGMECTEHCPIYYYYERRDIIIHNTILLHLGIITSLIFFKMIVLCFTHMRKRDFYSKNFNCGTDGSPEETATLLA